MNITINIKFSANVLLLTMFALFTYSCTKENEVTGARIYEGEKIPMSIKMGTRNDTTDKDEVINSVRAIVFNDKNELVYNDVSDASTLLPFCEHSEQYSECSSSVQIVYRCFGSTDNFRCRR